MILSTNQELGEYELIKLPEHVSQVWEAIETRLQSYWEKFVSAHQAAAGADQLVAKYGGTGAKPKGTAQAIATGFRTEIEAFQKDAVKYQTFFEAETLDEYQDEPNAFKHALSKEVPVIARTLLQPRPELQEWQRFFRATRSKELLQVFINVIGFIRDEWASAHPAMAMASYETADQFGLDPLDADETMTIPNVIGMGIKSIVLYHLDPERLPARGRNGLYGFYFLSGRDHFGLPSRSSEFLMVNDRNLAPNGSMIMDQNYWYPYGLFALYSWRLYLWLESKAAEGGYTIDPHLRFVFTDAFLAFVCSQHKADLATMRAHDRFGF